MQLRRAVLLLAPLLLGATDPPNAGDYRSDAQALDALIVANYAYLDRFGGKLPASAKLDRERDVVVDRKSLLHYAERRIASLADHHAITGSSFADSWALVPSYADLWVVSQSDGFRIDAVRAASPAARAGIVAGDRLLAVGDVPVAQAVGGFWADLGIAPDLDPDQSGYAARVLVGGRRDATRRLTIAHDGISKTVVLPSLYATNEPDPPPVAISKQGRVTTISIGNSLGDDATIAAFDAAMVAVPTREPVVLDLTNTPSGGNSTVARAILSWFVVRPTYYQTHRLIAEERSSGIVRQWSEQVLPRPGKHHALPMSVRVGRWTGSMGEGIAIGFDAIGAKVCGGAMAGLRGAVFDFDLPKTGLRVKFPAEQLFAIDGRRRERFVAAPCR